MTKVRFHFRGLDLDYTFLVCDLEFTMVYNSKASREFRFSRAYKYIQG
jgi:hypothetical protein